MDGGQQCPAVLQPKEATMTIRNGIGLAVGAVVATLALATPAGAAWWGSDGRWHYDYRDRYYTTYDNPPVVYTNPAYTYYPTRYRYYAPPPPAVYTAPAGPPGFSIILR
jgi:hypothetical protein